YPNRYGLIIPGQQKKTPARPVQPTKPSIFDESSDSASDEDPNAPQLKAKPPGNGVSSGPSLMERRVARRQQEKALAEDPTIFQYDELYDEMDQGRAEQKQSKSQEPRKPKYIGNLMKHAERRKLEKELRIERQVQKDREAEGEEFKDKDSYVTAAYRKQLESMHQLKEQEQREEYLEAIGDVTKQKDLDGFYRHLYQQKLGTGAGELEVKPKTAPSTEEVSYKPIRAEAPKHRSYRQRRPSQEDDEVEAKDKESTNKTQSELGEGKPAPAHLANNIDADSDFSIDDSSDEEEGEGEKKKEKEKEKKKKEAPEQKQEKKQPKDQDKEKENGNEKLSEKASPANEESTPEKDDADAKDLPVPVVTKPVVDRTLIWRKRTVGEVFQEALARYHERKRSRQG
ncbi:hypothetical protein KR009_009690, partial [Drosophila setifemur]